MVSLQFVVPRLRGFAPTDPLLFRLKAVLRAGPPPKRDSRGDQKSMMHLAPTIS